MINIDITIISDKKKIFIDYLILFFKNSDYNIKFLEKDDNLFIICDNEDILNDYIDKNNIKFKKIIILENNSDKLELEFNKKEYNYNDILKFRYSDKIDNVKERVLFLINYDLFELLDGFKSSILEIKDKLFYFIPKNYNHYFIPQLVNYLGLTKKMNSYYDLKVICNECNILNNNEETEILLEDRNRDCINCGKIQEIGSKTLIKEDRNLFNYSNFEKLRNEYSLSYTNNNFEIIIPILNIYKRAVSIFLHICKFGYIINEEYKKNKNFSFKTWLEYLIDSKKKFIIDHHYDNQVNRLYLFNILSIKKIIFYEIDTIEIKNNNLIKFIDNEYKINNESINKKHVNYKIENNEYNYCGDIIFDKLEYNNYHSFYNDNTKKLVEEFYNKDFEYFKNFEKVIDFNYFI